MLVRRKAIVPFEERMERRVVALRVIEDVVGRQLPFGFLAQQFEMSADCGRVLHRAFLKARAFAEFIAGDLDGRLLHAALRFFAGASSAFMSASDAT